MQELKDICIDQLEVFLSDGKIFTCMSFIRWEVYIGKNCARGLDYEKNLSSADSRIQLNGESRLWFNFVFV